MHSVKILEKCLADSVLECIQNLENIVSENTRRQNHRYERRRTNDFHPKPTFQQTVIKKADTDLDAKINEIRVAMNKVSAKNKDQQKEVILNALAELKSMEQEMRSVYFMILNIASSNKFVCEVYMDIINDIMTMNRDFDIVLQRWYDDYMRTITIIKYTSGESDYDAFCQYNKTNDTLKAKTSFIVELYKSNILDKDNMNLISSFILTILFEWCEMDDKTNELEELIELLYIIVSKDKSLGLIFKIDVQKIVKMKKDHPERYKNISSRATFRSMDILDLMQE